MIEIEDITCMVCGKGRIVHAIGDSLSHLRKKHGGMKKIPEAERIEACKLGEKAALIEARHYEKLARKSRKLVDLNKLLQTKGLVFES